MSNQSSREARMAQGFAHRRNKVAQKLRDQVQCNISSSGDSLEWGLCLQSFSLALIGFAAV